MAKDEKIAFFQGLDELDELVSESDRRIGVGSVPLKRRYDHLHDAADRAHPSGSAAASHSQVRLVPAPTAAAFRSSPPSNKTTMPTPPSVRRSRPGKTPAKLAKKQSNKVSLQMQPEHNQIFRGLIFYYVPNNNIAMARKRRIEKAQEYGAIWAREWSDSVTHVIVDVNLCLSDVGKVVGLDQIQSTQIIVNETYPPDCIGFQVLLPTHQTRFQVLDDALPSKPLGRKIETLGNAREPQLKSLEKAGTGQVGILAEEKGQPQCIVTGQAPHSSRAAEPFGRDHATLSEGENVDELDKIVAEIQETADLPLDPEDEGFEPSSSKSSSESEDPSTSERQAEETRAPMSNLADIQRHFSCMQKHDGRGRESNPNCKTIDKLDKMGHYYDRTGDHWRTIAYRKCITALKRQSKHITTREEAVKIPGIGERLALKVEEIALTDRLRRLESKDQDPTDRLLQLFMGIYQVGAPTASRWIAQGYKSLEDLRLHADLTTNQRVGLEHYDDFLARISRSEVVVHADIVKRACAKADAGIQVIVGGSYRRGAADSGDIDLIITKEDASLEYIRIVLTETVIPSLFREGFLKAGLATCSSTAQSQGSKWHGASAVPDSRVWRRIDLLFVPWNEFGAALIYFTGNDIFNRSMRLLASRKQMRLNQHGLYGDVMRGRQRERITQGQLLEGRCEERIFALLGVPWRPPEHRIC